MTFKSPESEATAVPESNVVGTCEVEEFDLALPFPLFNDYARVNLICEFAIRTRTLGGGFSLH